MKRLYWTLGIFAALLVADLTVAHFNKRVHHEIYFYLFDHDGSERKLRKELLRKRIERNLENRRELSADSKQIS